MAEFCRQCSWEDFQEDQSDLDHFGRGQPPLEPDHGYPCICEGCGFILVDEKGSCISDDCIRKGHKGRKVAADYAKP
jgi:hypothetical protein